MIWLAPFLSLAMAGAAEAAPHRLTLDEALAAARVNQPDLRRARADVDAAKARARQALAPLLPQLSGVAQYQRTTGNFVARPGAVPAAFGGAQSASFDTFNFYYAGLTATQLIYDFGRTWGQRQSSEALAQSSAQTRQATSVTVALAVRLAFFDARAAHDLVRVAQEGLTNQARHLRQIEGFVELGTRPQIDLAQARTDFANARVQLINAEATYATMKAELVRAMGVDGQSAFEVADDGMPPVEGESLELDALVSMALAGRPEISALVHQVRSQAYALSSVRGGYWPRLSATTNFTESGSSLDALTWNWDVTVALSWSLYEGGLAVAQARESSALLERARADLLALKQSVRVEVERARLGIVSAKASRAAAADAVESAKQRLRLAEGRYETGVGSVIELADARLAVTHAESQQVQADYDLAAARASLQSTLGRP